MLTLLQFIARISTLLYVLAAIGIFFGFRGLSQARQALRVAVFGLERESAREKLRRSTSTVILLFLLIGAVYTTKNIVLPNMAGSADEATPTPSIVFVTQEATATEAKLLYPTVTPTIPVAPGGVQATQEAGVNGCQINGTTITNPTPNQSVSGQVSVSGTANILKFAQYKFEVSGPSTGGSWVVVGTFFNPVVDGFLGQWDSTSLIPGNYTLRMVVIKQDGTYLTPCEVPITVASPAGGAPAAP